MQRYAGIIYKGTIFSFDAAQMRRLMALQVLSLSYRALRREDVSDGATSARYILRRRRYRRRR